MLISKPISPSSSRTTLGRQYLIRGVVALVWAGLLVAIATSAGTFTPQQEIPPFIIALLVAYPLIDLFATLFDVHSSRRRSHNAAAQWVNAAISAVTAVTMFIAASNGADVVFQVFGTWALLTGIIQLAVALVRRRRGTPGQLPMILSGSISTFAGLGFVLMSTQSDLNLVNLAAYATAGAIFFLVSALRQRNHPATRIEAPQGL